MTKLSTFVAAVARHPANFIKEVREDIKELNERAAEKPAPGASELSDEDLMAEMERRAKASAKKK